MFTDPANRVTRFTHDAEGQITLITDPDSHSRSFEYNSFNLLVSQVDKLGRVKNYAYDSIGSVIHSTRPDATLMSGAFRKLSAYRNRSGNTS